MGNRNQIETPITNFVNGITKDTGESIEKICSYRNVESLVTLHKVVECYESETGKKIHAVGVKSSTTTVSLTFGRKGVNMKKIDKCVNCSPHTVVVKVDDKKDIISMSSKT